MIEKDDEQVQLQPEENNPDGKKSWEAPSLTSFKPISDTQGLRYRIGDGLSNLT
jgi:hypothetical protein